MSSKQCLALQLYGMKERDGICHGRVSFEVKFACVKLSLIYFISPGFRTVGHFRQTYDAINMDDEQFYNFNWITYLNIHASREKSKIQASSPI